MKDRLTAAEREFILSDDQSGLREVATKVARSLLLEDQIVRRQVREASDGQEWTLHQAYLFKVDAAFMKQVLADL